MKKFLFRLLIVVVGLGFPVLLLVLGILLWIYDSIRDSILTLIEAWHRAREDGKKLYALMWKAFKAGERV